MESPVLLRRFGSGEAIVQPGDPAQALFIVHTGAVEVKRSKGPPARLGPGEMFGEVPLILGAPYRLSAVALSETAVVVVGLSDLQWLCLDSPDFVFRLVRHLAERVQSGLLDERSEARDRAARLARVILDLAADGETPAQVEGRLRDLADASNLPIGEAYRWVQGWLEQRVLRLAEDQLTLVEPEAMRAIAQPPQTSV
jgi:CRP-like cAMP-binding protein